MARKSEYPAWEKFNRALTTYRKHQQEYSNAKPGSKVKSRLQNILRDDGLRLQTYFNEQTRYNTTTNPSTILNPNSGKAAGQWHHAATQKRLLPFLLTVKTRQDYVKLTDAFKQYGLGIGNAYQNMFDLPGELHASNDPRAIHRVEEIAGLDAPDRYLKPGATVDDAIKAIPYLAEDVTGSKGLARQLQMQGLTIGKNSRFSEQVMQTSTEELSDLTHQKRARNLQTAQLAIDKRNRGLSTAKAITNENYNVVHGQQLIDEVTPTPQVMERGKGLGGVFSKINVDDTLRNTLSIRNLKNVAASVIPDPITDGLFSAVIPALALASKGEMEKIPGVVGRNLAEDAGVAVGLNLAARTPWGQTAIRAATPFVKPVVSTLLANPIAAAGGLIAADIAFGQGAGAGSAPFGSGTPYKDQDEWLYKMGGGNAAMTKYGWTVEQTRLRGQKNLELQHLETMKIE